MLKLKLMLTQLGLSLAKRKRNENNVVFSGHYVIASSLLPEQRPLERRTLVPIYFHFLFGLESNILYYVYLLSQLTYKSLLRVSYISKRYAIFRGLIMTDLI